MAPRIIARRLVPLVLLVLTFIGTVTTLNLTLYSASGFVSSYLDALAVRDLEGALRMPGVTLAGNGTDELLAPTALAQLSAIRLIRDSDAGGGQHTLQYGYDIGGIPTTSTFRVEHTGPRLGVFSGWRFVQSPQSVLEVTVRNGAGIRANGVSLPDTVPGQVHAYRVLTPSRVKLTHTSTYLASSPAPVTVDQPSSLVSATVNIQANAGFVRAVKKELASYLSACVTQQVLQPTACPMGKAISDRIQSAPTWTMITYPAIRIVPGDRAGSWQIPTASGLAHIRVQVRSIFDGRLSFLDENVAFAVRYSITFTADGSPLITGQP